MSIERPFGSGALAAALATLSVLSAGAAQLSPTSGGSTFSVPLRAETWRLRPDLAPDQAKGARVSITPFENGLRFSSEGWITQPRSATWSAPLSGRDLSRFQYLVVEYRAQWVEQGVQPVLAITGRGGAPKAMSLLAGQDLIADGAWHRLIARKSLPGSADELRVSLDSRHSRAYLTLRAIRFLAAGAALGASVQADTIAAIAGSDFRPIHLGRLYNTRYDSLMSGRLAEKSDALVSDGGSYFSSPAISVAGIPFSVRPNGDNLVSPPPEPAANADQIVNFGIKVKRGRVAPISRDSLIEVDVDAPATEVFLLLAGGFPYRKSAAGAPKTPTTIEDVEWFAVELLYADGSSDLAFPYSIADGRHVIHRTLGVYAVPANGKRLRRLILHNRMPGGDVCLAALTVNTGRTRRFPNLAETAPLPATPAAEPPAQALYARRSGTILQLGNRYIAVTIDAARGFAIRELKNRWLPAEQMQVESSPGLEVNLEGRTLAAADLQLGEIQSLPNGFSVAYSSRDPEVPLDFNASVRVDTAPEIRFRLTVTNRSAAVRNTTVRFPKVSGLRIGTGDDLWYFFPKYRNALGNEPATYYSQAGLAYVMQFFDVFNPKLGGGVYLLSRDLTHKAQRYYLAKDGSGATFFLEYPELYTHLEPGQSYLCTDTAIGAHAGDWHGAAKTYSDWVATWYQPYKSQQDSKAWYRSLFWLLTEILDGLDPDTYKMPIWYDAETKRYRIRDVLQEFEQASGGKPDLLHLWGWNWGGHRFGIYGEPNYNDQGGLKNFRAALDDVQQNLKTPVSLYIDANLCSRGQPFCEELGPELGMRGPDGRLLNEYRSYRMCLLTRKWQDHMKEVYQRVYRETGASILYVDEIGSKRACYTTGHGHPVPSSQNEADYTFLKAIREATSAEVALYGEYPVTDVTSQFWDCNIAYYLDDYGKDLGPTYDEQPTGRGMSPALFNLVRFLYPRVLQLDLPLAGFHHHSWQALKFTFFNGEPVYDSFWDRFESRGQEFMVRTFNIKKEYVDCFTSDHPEMLVTTEKPLVAANKYPGKGRTLWTLYNQGYSTARGRTLAVQHVKGATYYDAWRQRAIEPVIEDGNAILSTELEPQGIGCLVQVLPVNEHARGHQDARSH